VSCRPRCCAAGKIKTCAAYGVGSKRWTRHPQTGAAGIPESGRAFTCVNLLRASGLDFPCIRPVFVRKREDRSGRASRKHVDFAGVHRKPYHHGRSVPSAGCFDAPIFPRGCTERGRPVKALRYAPTAGRGAQKTRGLDLPPSPLLCVSAIEKM
jgi:hypothetical protein